MLNPHSAPFNMSDLHNALPKPKPRSSEPSKSEVKATLANDAKPGTNPQKQQGGKGGQKGAKVKLVDRRMKKDARANGSRKKKRSSRRWSKNWVLAASGAK